MCQEKNKNTPSPEFSQRFTHTESRCKPVTRPVNTIDCDTNNLREGEKSVGGIKEKKGVGSIVRSCVSDDKEN
jgi:hypothetical protein